MRSFVWCQMNVACVVFVCLPNGCTFYTVINSAELDDDF